MRPLSDRSNFRRSASAGAGGPTLGLRVDKGEDGDLFDQRQGRQCAARSDGPARPQARLPDPRHRADVLYRFPGRSTGGRQRGCRVANAARQRSITYTYPREGADVARISRAVGGASWPACASTKKRMAAWRGRWSAPPKNRSASCPSTNDPPLPQDAGRAEEAHRRRSTPNTKRGRSSSTMSSMREGGNVEGWSSAARQGQVSE